MISQVTRTDDLTAALPEEIISAIFSYLGPVDLVHCCQNKQLTVIASTLELWKKFVSNVCTTIPLEDFNIRKYFQSHSFQDQSEILGLVNLFLDRSGVCNKRRFICKLPNNEGQFEQIIIDVVSSGVDEETEPSSIETWFLIEKSALKLFNQACLASCSVRPYKLQLTLGSNYKPMELQSLEIGGFESDDTLDQIEDMDDSSSARSDEPYHPPGIKDAIYQIVSGKFASISLARGK